jgi:molybdopterin synthase catalytic subunit
MIGVKIILFGPARDAAGTDQVTMELPDGATVQDLSTVIGRRYAGLRHGLASLRFAVNASFAEAEQVLSDGDEVAVIPPVSGGSGDPDSDMIQLSEAPLVAGAIFEHLRGGPDSADGGVCVFEGRTRIERHPAHGPLIALTYEAYSELALKQMRDMARRARERWPMGKVAVVHRVGRVLIGEPSVIIGVTSGHRAEAFEACRWLIDTLKREVPIWKKEIWESGESSWVDPTQM